MEMEAIQKFYKRGKFKIKYEDEEFLIFVSVSKQFACSEIFEMQFRKTANKIFHAVAEQGK